MVSRSTLAQRTFYESNAKVRWSPAKWTKLVSLETPRNPIKKARTSGVHSDSLRWTYPDNLTNDHSFVLTEKWMAVKPYSAVWKRRNMSLPGLWLRTNRRGSDKPRLRRLHYQNKKLREGARKVSLTSTWPADANLRRNENNYRWF